MDLKTFFEQFDTIAEAPGGIQVLRNLILDMAVRGKLVPQDLNDEPAKNLVTRLQEKKNQLISEKKIPKAKKLEPIAIDSLPYQTPHNWDWSKLGGISKTVEYGTSSKASLNRNDVPILRMNNIEKGQVTLENLKYVPDSIKDLPRLYLQDKDLLFNRTNSYELVGKTGIFRGGNNRYTFASYLIRVSLFTESTLPEFINLAMNSGYFRQTQIEPEITQQCGQANFNGTKLQNSLIPIPPIAEQKRIVAKVDELMGLCDRFQAEKQQRDELRRSLRASAFDALMNAPTDDALTTAWSFVRDHWPTLSQHPDDVKDMRRSVLQLAIRGKLVFQDLEDQSISLLLDKVKLEKKDQIIGKGRKKKSIKTELSQPPYPVPNNWKWIKLDDILLSSFYGPRFGKDEYTSNGVISIRTTDMTDRGEIHLKDPPRVPVPEDKLPLYALERDDLLITRSGSIGTMAIFRGDYQAIPSAYLIRFRFSKLISVDYIYCFFKSHLGQSLLGLGMTKQAQPNINAKSISSFTLPLPPLAEQKRIFAKVDELMQECDAIETHLQQQQQLAQKFAASAVSHLTV